MAMTLGNSHEESSVNRRETKNINNEVPNESEEINNYTQCKFTESKMNITWCRNSA